MGLIKERGLYEQEPRHKKYLNNEKLRFSVVVAAQQLAFEVRDKPVNVNMLGKQPHTIGGTEPLKGLLGSGLVRLHCSSYLPYLSQVMAARSNQIRQMRLC